MDTSKSYRRLEPIAAIGICYGQATFSQSKKREAAHSWQHKKSSKLPTSCSTFCMHDRDRNLSRIWLLLRGTVSLSLFDRGSPSQTQLHEAIGTRRETKLWTIPDAHKLRQLSETNLQHHALTTIQMRFTSSKKLYSQEEEEQMEYFDLYGDGIVLLLLFGPDYECTTYGK